MGDAALIHTAVRYDRQHWRRQPAYRSTRLNTRPCIHTTARDRAAWQSVGVPAQSMGDEGMEWQMVAYIQLKDGGA